VSSGVETRTVSAGSGRELCVEIAGEPDGKPILVHTGEPMSRRLYGGWIADAKKKGIRLIGYDRPGYGGLTARPGYTVASLTDDVRAPVMTATIVLPAGKRPCWASVKMPYIILAT
jgi:pimeloyl-ACP methyl ester carboxylesterase